MDIDRMIADDTVRERALYERVKAAEREMEPLKRRFEAERADWSEVYNRIKTLRQMKEMLSANATGENAPHGPRCAQRIHTAAECTCGKSDAAVLAADRAELAAQDATE